MDINRDEVRRQLRDAQTEQRQHMAGFRSSLHRIFNSSDISSAAKAEIAGVPGRRQFLKIGGITVLGAAVIAACGGDDEGNTVAESGTTAGSTATTGATDTTAPDGGNTDIVLARTAASLENLAVILYSVALGEGGDVALPAEIAFDPAVVDAAKLFRDHHQAHADALNSILTGAGEDEYTDPNQFVFENVVAPKLPSLTDQAAVVSFALDVENIAAGTYAYAASVLSTPELRQSIMGIGGVEARHASALSLVLDPTGGSAVPRSFTDASTEGRIPDDALVTA